MNRLKAIAIIAIITTSVFSALLYSSCNKDACVGVTCFNNSSCNNGNCICPLGFSGTQCANRNITTIVYQNNSLSYVTVSVNATGGGSSTISPGESFAVTGNYGKTAIGSATTYGYSSSVGQTVTWNLNDTFPATGVVTVPLNIPSSYFYLYIINNNASYYVTQAIVNYNLPTQTTVTGLNIYSGSGTAYGVGYFRSSSTPNVLLSDYTSHSWPTINFTLPDTINQSYTAIVN